MLRWAAQPDSQPSSPIESCCLLLPPVHFLLLQMHQVMSLEQCHASGDWLQLQVVDAQTLEPVEDVTKQSTVIAIAAFFGSVRLIDNLEIECTPQLDGRA